MQSSVQDVDALWMPQPSPASSNNYKVLARRRKPPYNTSNSHRSPRPPPVANSSSISMTSSPRKSISWHQLDPEQRLRHLHTPLPPSILPHATSSPSNASSMTAFRSIQILEQVVRMEKDAQLTDMTPDEAIALLRRIVPPSFQKLHVHQHPIDLLEALEASIWRTFAGDSKPSGLFSMLQSEPVAWAAGLLTPPMNSPRTQRLQPPSATATSCMKLPYHQLYHGLKETIHDKKRSIHWQTHWLVQLTDQTNILPAKIKEVETTIASTIASFNSISAATLENATAMNPMALSPAKQKELARTVADKIATLRRRRELRTWTCNELRVVINDHMTHVVELKKEIAQLQSEIRKEDLLHKVKAKRMEEIMAPMATNPTAQTNANGNGAMSPRRGKASMRDLMIHSQSKPGTPGLTGKDRLFQAQQRKTQLLDIIADKKAHLRQRTEQVFDVRNHIREVTTKKSKVLHDIQSLEEEIQHVERACTPRPEWEELESMSVVTTAMDRVNAVQKKRKSWRRSGTSATFAPPSRANSSRLYGTTRHGSNASTVSIHHNAAEDSVEDDVVERHVKQILSSKWSTIDKVNALCQELERIRLLYHAGDAIASEQAKLDHLQKEIAKTLQQLEIVKSRVQASK